MKNIRSARIAWRSSLDGFLFVVILFSFEPRSSKGIPNRLLNCKVLALAIVVGRGVDVVVVVVVVVVVGVVVVVVVVVGGGGGGGVVVVVVEAVVVVLLVVVLLVVRCGGVTALFFSCGLEGRAGL